METPIRRKKWTYIIFYNVVIMNCRVESPIEKALERARGLVGNISFSELPVDINRLAKSFGVSRIDAVRMKTDGYMGKQDNGDLVILYNIDNPERRNRFTIAHEIGHIILDQARGIEAGGGQKRTYHQNREDEYAADAIAAELLMPEKLVYQETSGKKASWNLLTRLRHIFAVSETTIALRILEIRGLWSLLFRIPIEENDFIQRMVCKFETSKYCHLKLVHDKRIEAARLWNEVNKTTKHNVEVIINKKKENIPCEGVLRNINVKTGKQSEYWVIGWKAEGA